MRPPNPKPASAARQQFPFPPPPKTPAQRPAFTTTNQKQASSGADKFNAFTRGAPQTWDRSKYDEARAEAAKVFPNMRPPLSTQRGGRAPTAPKASPSSEMPHVPNVPPTSFPGLSRTASSRRTDYQGGDGQQVPPSAFSYVQGSRRQQAPNPHINVQESYSMRSPPVSRARPSVSPLRHTRSSDHDMRYDLGGRPPSRYAGGGGERTDLHGDGLHRSSSVRNSPIDDRGPFGRSSTRYESIPRHRSASPGMRKAEEVHVDEYSSSSSEEEEELHMNARPKATPRSRPTMRTGHSYSATVNNPGLTGQFPSTNYTRIVDESRYQYPPPEMKEPIRKPFPDMTSPDVEKPNMFHDDHGGSERPKYAPFPKEPQVWPHKQNDRRAQRGYSINGFPSWAVPSSVFPQQTPPRVPNRPTSVSIDERGFVQSWNDRTNAHDSDASAQPNASSTFSAAEWHDKLKADDIFRPDNSQMRKSPSKTSRPGSKPAARGRAQSQAAEQDPPSEHANGADKSKPFPPGKLAEDWHSRATAPPKAAGVSSDSDSEDSRDRYVVVEEDAMDVDTPPTNGNHHPVSNGVKPSSNGINRSDKRRSSNGGVNLSDFAQHAPFAPASGLGGMKDDLETHLPFESRAAKDVNINRETLSNARVLNLPRPPKLITPPAEDRLDKTNFDHYVLNMQAYMREWNAFNAKMIEHFRSRQDRVCGTMSQNWISQIGDGPEAEILEKDDNSDKQAGYAAYMKWLKDDATCRDWWEEANQKHLHCLEDLGKTREAAKKKFMPLPA